MKKIFLKFTAIVLLLMVMMTTTSCGGLMTEFVRQMAGDEFADRFKQEYDAQMDASREEFNDLMDELNDQVDDAIPEILDQLEEAFKESTVLATLYWSSMEGKTPGTIQEPDGSYTSPYNNKFSKGQCTWYAYGRFLEDNGIALPVAGNAKGWLDECESSGDTHVRVERDLEKIVPGCVAVDYKTSNPSHPGHVTYVEYVTYDEDGKPQKVYFTESNWDVNGQYDKDIDGVVTIRSYNEFINRGDHRVLGYIIPRWDWE